MLDWVKRHPYLTGGLVLGAIVFFVVYRSVAGSNSAAAQAASAANPDIPPNEAALQVASLQASAQTQSINAQLQAQTNQVVAAQNVATLQSNAQVTEAQLAQQAALQQIVSSAAVQTQANTLAYQTVQAQVGGQVSLAQIQTQGQVDIAGTQAGVQEQAAADALAQEQAIQAAATEQANIGATAQVNLANISASAQEDIANINAGVENLQTTTAGQIQMAGITGQVSENASNNALSQYAINAQRSIESQSINTNANEYNAYLNTTAGVDVAQINANQQTTQSAYNLIGTGVFNKGGTGGANQTSAFETATTGNNAPIASPPSSANAWASLANAAGRTAATIFGS